MSRHCCEHPGSCRTGDGLFATIFKLLLLYAVVVFLGGTLIHTGHPVAIEVGQLLHAITFVDPAINWTGAHGWDHVSHGLRVLANGVPIAWMAPIV